MVKYGIFNWLQQPIFDYVSQSKSYIDIANRLTQKLTVAANLFFQCILSYLIHKTSRADQTVIHDPLKIKIVATINAK